MPTIEIAFGEFYDRLTILQIKEKKLSSSVQRLNVSKEISEMQKYVSQEILDDKKKILVQKLHDINLEIWNKMDSLYQVKEANDLYAKLSYQITWLNQKRAFAKREIDTAFNSKNSEEKSYFTKFEELVENDL
jgi:hypothetical protein